MDTLKTTSTGLSGVLVTWIEWLPVIVRVLVGLATFVYLCVQIYKLVKS